MDDAVGECNRPSTDAYASRLLPMGGRFWFPPGVRQVHSCRQGAVMGRWLVWERRVAHVQASAVPEDGAASECDCCVVSADTSSLHTMAAPCGRSDAAYGK